MRFLACFVSSPNQVPSLRLELHQLRHATKLEDYTYPCGTIFFTILDAKDANEIYEKFVIVKIFEGIEMSSLNYGAEKGNQFYFVGKKVKIKNHDFIYNSFAQSLIPFQERENFVVVPE